MRPASQRFFIHSCIYLRISIISYLATFLLGTNSLSVLMCRKAVNQSTMVVRRWPAFLQWQLDRLQSVLNAAGRLIYNSTYPWNLTTWRHCCTTFTGCESQNESRFGWRFWRTTVRTDLLHYLADEIHQVADVESQRRLRSALTVALIVPATVRSTIGDRSFSVTVAQVWNGPQLFVTSLLSLPVFRKNLKTVLFTRSFPS